jgi:deoxyadenosine/deoxycytidine kinase
VPTGLLSSRLFEKAVGGPTEKARRRRPLVGQEIPPKQPGPSFFKNQLVTEGAMARIEICGGIGSGKSTLANILTPKPVLEKFSSNPFWKMYYANPERWVEEKNFTFLVQHVGSIKEADDSDLVVCDYAVAQDLAYASLVTRPNHFALMRALYAHLYGQLPPPALIIHLRCPSAILLERIAKRGRQEEAEITSETLDKLNSAIEMVLKSEFQHSQVFTITSDRLNFANDPTVAAELRDELLSRATASEP